MAVTHVGQAAVVRFNCRESIVLHSAPLPTTVWFGHLRSCSFSGGALAPPRRQLVDEFCRVAQLDIRHPKSTGMQTNQVAMLYTPIRFVNSVEVRQGDETIFTLEGSMTLSENPRITFDYKVNGASVIVVRTKDTSDAVWMKEFPVGSSS